MNENIGIKRKDKKVVLFFTESWANGGIETFIINTIKSMPLDSFEFVIFAVYDIGDERKDLLDTLGVEYHVIFHGYDPGLLCRFTEGIRQWRALLKSKKYDVVHVNAMNGLSMRYAVEAKKAGVSKVVTHSHNSSFGAGMYHVKKLIHILSRAVSVRSCGDRIACSESAGRYLFGRSSFEVVNNGIDCKRFKFNHDNRALIRGLLEIKDDEFVFGSVGRLDEQKNPLFQVDILKELLSEGQKVRLLLAGSGSMLEEIKTYACHVGVENRVILFGPTQEPEKILSALDCLTMPSRFEGLPFVLIEGLCSGLHCLLSETIDDNLACDRIKHLSTKDVALWCKAIKEMKEKDTYRDRSDGVDCVRSLGFDINQTADKIAHIYGM